MTDLKFYLLDKVISAHPTNPIHKIELLNSGFTTPTAIHVALKDLKELKWIFSPVGSDTIYITPLGRAAYEESQQIRKQDSKNKKQQAFDNKISVASILVPLVTFFLGIFTEHFTDVVSAVISLFK